MYDETEGLARRVADARHVPVDTVVRQGLEAIARDGGIIAEAPFRRPLADRQRDAIRRLVDDIAAMPVVDRRSVREIMDDLDPE